MLENLAGRWINPSKENGAYCSSRSKVACTGSRTSERFTSWLQETLAADSWFPPFQEYVPSYPRAWTTPEPPSGTPMAFPGLFPQLAGVGFPPLDPFPHHHELRAESMLISRLFRGQVRALLDGANFAMRVTRVRAVRSSPYIASG